MEELFSHHVWNTLNRPADILPVKLQVWMFVIVWNKISNYQNYFDLLSSSKTVCFVSFILSFIYLCNYCVLLFKYNFKTIVNTIVDELMYKQKIYTIDETFILPLRITALILDLLRNQLWAGVEDLYQLLPNKGLSFPYKINHKNFWNCLPTHCVW